MIRALRPTDLVGLALFLRRAPGSEITAHMWPKIQPESGHLPLNQAVWQSVGQGPTRGRAWVAEDEGKIVGLAVARARCSGLVWDVEHLHASEGGNGQAEELLDRVCHAAASGGARRVFFEAPIGQRGSEIARRAGFERYTGASVYRLDPPFRVPKDGQFEGRPRLRADEQAMFQLYNAAVPVMVRSAEAMSYEEWSALHRGPKRWAPSLVGDRHQYVWELGEGLAGWLEVVYGHKSQFLEFLVHSKYESLLDRFVGYALKQVSGKAPVYSAVREYQAGLGAALERVGFKLAGRHDIYVRQLAVRVPERKLAPAGIIGG
jgi:hypothetical protein